MRRVIPFHKLDDPDPLQVGIIAAQRARLYQAELPVAPGFVLTPAFFKELLISSDQHEAFFTVVKSAQQIDEIHDYIKRIQFPGYIEDEIVQGCELFGKVSVTTSAAFHDAVFELHGLDESQVIDAIRSSWASLFHDTRRKWLNKRTVFPAVLIQKDMNPTKSGTVYTHNPVNQSASRVIIEVDYPKKGYVAVSKKDGKLAGMKGEKVPLSDAEKNQLLDLAKRAERYFGAPQKVDWVLGDELFMTESRDITKEDASYFFSQETSSASNAKEAANESP